VPAAAAALVALAAWAAAVRRTPDAARDLADAWRFLEGRSTWLIAPLAAAGAAAALHFQTFAAAGADSSGYLSEGALLASGRLLLPDILAQLPSWPIGPWGTTPLGWRPALTAGLQAPTYPPGLPLLMAPLHAAGGAMAASLLVPAAAALTIAAAGGVARLTGGGVAGLLAALLVAVSPTFLYQSFQPMSDVPVTAAWMGCWWLVARGRPLGAGVAAAIAMLIRPNLAPVAAVPVLAIAIAGSRRVRAGSGTSGRVGWPAAVLFTLPIILAGAAIAALQWHWYGSPLSSGYGSVGEIFSLANVWPNIEVYSGWLTGTQPVLWLAPLAVLGRRDVSATTRRADNLLPFFLVFIAAIVIAYLVYNVFETWSYLRFLLPAVAMAAVLVGVAASRSIEAMPAVWRAPASLALALAMLAHGLLSARSHEVTRVADDHRRMAIAGPYLAAALPPGAVLIAGEQSGAARYYTGRGVLRWETLSPPDLAAALARLDQDRREVWWVLDQWEEPLVRSRLAGLAAAALDWPPVLEAGPAMLTRAWRVADRDRFLGGARVTTDRLR
jgi:hypothetical protein